MYYLQWKLSNIVLVESEKKQTLVISMSNCLTLRSQQHIPAIIFTHSHLRSPGHSGQATPFSHCSPKGHCIPVAADCIHVSRCDDNIIDCLNYNLMNSTGATKHFSANYKKSSQQKNKRLFILDQSQMKVKSDWELM